MENKNHFYHSLEFDAKIKIIIYKSYEKMQFSLFNRNFYLTSKQKMTRSSFRFFS